MAGHTQPFSIACLSVGNSEKLGVVSKKAIVVCFMCARHVNGYMCVINSQHVFVLPNTVNAVSYTHLTLPTIYSV